jgi:hypothetical protein
MENEPFQDRGPWEEDPTIQQRVFRVLKQRLWEHAASGLLGQPGGQVILDVLIALVKPQIAQDVLAMLHSGSFPLRDVHAQRGREAQLAPEIIGDPRGEVLHGREEPTVGAQRAELDRQREPETFTLRADLDAVGVGQRPVPGDFFL